ncbi:hypothetical protein [Streptomyces sp. NPDC088748]|uniref:hypothetical protein n=1 Tax=Streptomyces sp. NPDC088748 TaxID=3365887 RepID=UPI0037FC375F
MPSGAESAAAPRTAAGTEPLRITEPELNGRIALAWRADGPPGPAAHELLRRLRSGVPGGAAP